MPRVRVLRATVAAGRVLGVGEVLDLSNAEVGILLPRGKVELVFDGPDAGAPVPTHADPVAVSQDPAPRRTRRAR
jgi:hypothetical protein